MQEQLLKPVLLEDHDHESDRLGTIVFQHMPKWASITYRIALAYICVFAVVRCRVDEDGDVELFDGITA